MAGDPRIGIFEREFARYFKFAVVRNSWDRLVSAYRFIYNGGGQVEHDLEMQARIKPYEDFGHFVRSWLVPSGLRRGIHFLPQSTFVCLDDGTVPLDFVGHFETLADDFCHITQQLGVERSLQHLNASQRRHYKDYYDPETVAIVAELYREDIELLGYDFDNANQTHRSSH